jgi:hypothetical protein
MLASWKRLVVATLALSSPALAEAPVVDPVVDPVIDSREALRQNAAQLLGCPVEQVRVREVLLGRPHNPSEVELADGCGQRVVYGSTPQYANDPPARRFYIIGRFSMMPAKPTR